MSWEKGESFWVDDAGEPLTVPTIEGSTVIENGFRYVWTRNEFGRLYRKNVDIRGQIGGHLTPVYTLQEYAAQCRAMAEQHASQLSPEIRAMVGHEVMMADAFAPMNMLPSGMGSETGPVFL